MNNKSNGKNFKKKDNKKYYNHKAAGAKQGKYYDKSTSEPKGKDAYMESSSNGSRGSYDSYHSNDISWWNKSPMYPDVTRVPFNRIYGSPVNLRASAAHGHDSKIPEINRLPFGSIMTFDFVPSIGTTIDGNASVNRAFNSLFGELYARTTGTPPIQQADVAMFITSLASVSVLIAHVKRALGVSQLYSNLNYLYPHILLQSMHLDDSSIIGHQDEVRYALNDCILNFNNLKVPNVMDIYVRQYALAHNVYADEDDVMSQLFLFNPAGYYVYDDSLSRCTWKTFNYSSDLNVSVFIDAINECLESWRNSSDLGLISGTIQRAFAETETISLDYVREGDVVVPTPDRNIFWQIENMVVQPVVWSSLDISQDPVQNILICTPEPAAPTLYEDCGPWVYLNVGLDDVVLNSYDNNTGDEFIMESTRLIPYYSAELDQVMFPTEFVVNSKIIYVLTSEVGTLKTEKYTFYSTQVYGDTTTVTDMATTNWMHSMLSQFKHHPRIRTWYTPGSLETGNMHFSGMFGDLYRFTTIDNAALDGLDRCAKQSVYKTFTAPKYVKK